MVCDFNNLRCLDQGYCSCHQDRTNEAAGGCGGLLIAAVMGVVTAVFYPAARIRRADFEFDRDGNSKFAGTRWLFLSPLFGLLSNLLFSLLFSLAAGGAGAFHSQVLNFVYVIALPLTMALTTGLALAAFLFKNRETVKDFAVGREPRSVKKSLILVGVGIMCLLEMFFVLGTTYKTAEFYYLRQGNTQIESSQPEQNISIERDRYKTYVGNYEFTTRNDLTLFRISKNNDGKNLRLNLIVGKNNRNLNLGCLLSPNIEDDIIYYSVSGCPANEYLNLLQKVRFQTAKNKTIMTFIYDNRTNSDALEKVE